MKLSLAFLIKEPILFAYTSNEQGFFLPKLPPNDFFDITQTWWPNPYWPKYIFMAQNRFKRP